MKSKTGLAVAAALCALAGLAVLPSGAGQHFGIIGDMVAWGAEGASAGSDAPAGGPAGFTSEGIFVFGAGAGVTTSPSASPLTMAGCVAVQTPMGEDHGCLSSGQVRVPPMVADPTMQQAHLQVSVPSALYPGAVINVNLTFTGGEPVLAPEVSSDGTVGYRVSIAAGRVASLQGFVYSTRVGGHNPGGPGLIAKGAVVQTCSIAAEPCP